MICSVLHISVLFKNLRRMCYTLSNLFLFLFLHFSTSEISLYLRVVGG